MMGHTDKATINQRRPLTAGMLALLTTLSADRIPEWKLTGVEKNQMRGLLDRGYATWHIENRTHSITPEGRAALEKRS